MIAYRVPRGRGFEKLSEDGILPTRGTRKSAGYDFYLVSDVTIMPKESKIIPTHITAYMLNDEYLDLRLRSSVSLKGLIELNGCGVIDADYYGHDIGFIVYNLTDNPIHLYKGDRIGQGIFSRYALAEEDIVMSEERVGGFGSTNNQF